MATKQENEVTENLKRIELVNVKKIEGKDGTYFYSYKAVQKGGKLIDCKFTRDCKPPVSNAVITVDVSDMNIAKNTKFPCLWIKKIASVNDITGTKQTAEQKQELDDMFE